jgi:predicted Na+-dependent transporter
MWLRPSKPAVRQDSVPPLPTSPPHLRHCRRSLLTPLSSLARSGILEAQWSEKFLLVAIIFFISGLTLPPRSLWERSLDWRLHAATQLSSFLLFPTITFAIASFIRLADPSFERFNAYAIVGMVVMGVIPTTVSSNVVMTGQAGGDQSAATIEVMLGNLLGTFLSPALLQMFLSASKWSFGKPVASGAGGAVPAGYRAARVQRVHPAVRGGGDPVDLAQAGKVV